ncbi:histidine kinase [Antarcticibacterium sp. 1MA-6-2]|uniref:sensor histidine kinase n=1 Tax=Antarcticibacterium sp. 1MA-6-2 TaxID=2908210 RepID=UPI001F2CA242|nr:histidine kinase [Antarcticibacterium sp. 1MA-6-2]UJH92050.1 histidine kinase [Antarcticibacterium sp. 1MA-6-2]
MSKFHLKKYLDLNLVLLLAGFYTLFDIIYVGKMAYFRAHFPSGNEESWLDLLVFTILVDWLVVVTYMTLISVSTKRLLDRKYPWIKIITIHTILSILIGLIIRMIFDLFGMITGYINPSDYKIEESVHRFMSVIDLNFLIYFAMVFIIYTYYYLKQVKETEKQRNLLETQLVNTRMKMLSSQLQPHFLFNTLNSISVLADIDAGKAKDTIADLSDFLREILYCSDTNEITLEKELRTLEYYLNILTVRFSNDLKIRKDIDQNLLNKKVPALLLQPLIENSIKHGYSYNHTELEVLISVKSLGNYLIVKVTNNGEPVKLSSSELMQKGVGLANIKDRLKNLYNDNFFFEIKNKSEGVEGVETIVKIPL